MAKTGFGPINKDHPSSSKIQSGKGSGEVSVKLC